MWGRGRKRAGVVEAAPPKISSVLPDMPVIERSPDGAWQALDASGRVLAKNASLALLCGEIQTQHVGHVSLDTQVRHCIFCGSGDVFARSDGTVQCDLCHRSFYASEQPLYSAMPSPEYMGQEIGGQPPAPAPAPSFVPPPEASPPEMDSSSDPAKSGPPEPKDDDSKEDPFPKAGALLTSTGALLSEDEMARHLAYRFR